jgi:hypothetical protein
MPIARLVTALQTKTITVRFRLVGASGSAIAVAAAKALAAANGVCGVTFAGSGVRTVTAACPMERHRTGVLRTDHGGAAVSVSAVLRGPVWPIHSRRVS